jgi:hypothetical protein
MNIEEKKAIVRAGLTQVGVPALFDEILAASEIDPETRRITVTENGVYLITPDSSEDNSDDGYDGLSAVEVTVDVPATPGGTVTSFEDPIEFDSIEAAEELNSYDVKGALVSYNSTTGKYTAWNGEADLDARAWDYRADDSNKATEVNHSLSGEWINKYATDWSEDVEFPSNEYGEVIAVCVGKGVWVYLNWDPNNAGNKYKWCGNSESELYSTLQQACLLPKSGVEATASILAKVTGEDDSLFYALKTAGVEDGVEGHLYVPNIMELMSGKYSLAGPSIEAESVSADFTNAISHACRIINTAYWSSSQYRDALSVYNLNDNGGVGSSYKNYQYACLAFVRFGAALAVDEVSEAAI